MNCKVIGLLLIAAASAVAPSAAQAAATPAVDFAREPELSAVEISPDGQYIASLYPVEGHRGLVVIRLEDSKVMLKYSAGQENEIQRYWWTGPNRLVVSLAAFFGSLAQSTPTGELIAINADGTGESYLYGFRGVGNPKTGTTIRGHTMALGSAIELYPLQKDPKHALIAVHEWDPSKGVPRDGLYMLDVYDGSRRSIEPGPFLGPMTYLIDDLGTTRYAIGRDLSDHILAYARPHTDNDWQLLPHTDGRGIDIDPLALSKDSGEAYLSSDEGTDRQCLVAQNLQSGERRKLSCDEVADLTSAVFSFDGKTPIGAFYQLDRPSVKLLDTPHPDRIRYEALQAAFKGSVVLPISHTADGKKVVLLVYSDRNPGDYYLFDVDSLKFSPIGAGRAWIDPDKMGERRPIAFKNRDGEMIHGYLTLPPGLPAKGLPLIVMPHGGPRDVADNWRWDAQAQLLATSGYAVLQPNFHGSSGYGDQFKTAGRQAWDGLLINDIVDGTRWAIDQGYADSRRVCIFGASYGGYAALMAAIREPDLYRCAIGYAGVYDLVRMKTEGDLSESSEGKTFVTQFIGATDDRLRKASPINQLDKLKAALMIVHGEADERAPFSQAKALRKALDARHYPYEWMSKEGEGHGFANPENRAELNERLLAFLNRNFLGTAGTASH